MREQIILSDRDCPLKDTRGCQQPFRNNSAYNAHLGRHGLVGNEYEALKATKLAKVEN